MHWTKSDWMSFFEQIGYFLLAIVFFNSIGVWLPLAVDYYNCTSITTDTYKATPYNILTYFLGISSVAIIDRLKKLLNLQNHPSKFLEVLGWIFISCIFFTIVFFVLKNIKDEQVSQSIKLGLLGSMLSFLIWWIANYKESKSNPYDAWGKNPR